MKRQVHPAAAAGILLVIALLAGFFYWRGANPAHPNGSAASAAQPTFYRAQDPRSYMHLLPNARTPPSR